MKRYFLTVDWCSTGNRGIFCDSMGNCFSQDTPHTEEDFFRILDHFGLILTPLSLLLSEDEVAQYTRWVPLSEFSNMYGIALRKETSHETS